MSNKESKFISYFFWKTPLAMIGTKLSSLLHFIIEFLSLHFRSKHLSLHHILSHTCKFYTWEISDIFKQATLTISYDLTLEKEFKTFSIDNFVMVRICSKWFSQETVKDLQVCSAGFFNILKEFKLKYLCYRFEISFIFNIED